MSSERQTEVIRAQLVSKAVLSPDQTELYELTQLAGVTMDQQVFKIILDLLKLNVPPVAITQTLRSMCSPHKHGPVDLAVSEHLSALTDRRKDHSQDLIDLTHHSDQTVRGGSGRHQDNSLSQNRSSWTSDSYGQDGSGYSSMSLGKTNSQSSSRSQSHVTSDISYGRNKTRSHDSRKGISSSSRGRVT